MEFRSRYEYSEARPGYRSGHYDRKLTTISGDVTLHVPRLKGIRFETAIIERYHRRESNVEEALIEMYLAGVSVRRVEDIYENVAVLVAISVNKDGYREVQGAALTRPERYPGGGLPPPGINFCQMPESFLRFDAKYKILRKESSLV